MPPIFHPITGEKLPAGYTLAAETNRYDYTDHQDIHWSIYVPKRTASAAIMYAAENNYTEALRTSFPRDTDLIYLCSEPWICPEDYNIIGQDGESHSCKER
jgi:hypothetical protein